MANFPMAKKANRRKVLSRSPHTAMLENNPRCLDEKNCNSGKSGLLVKTSGWCTRYIYNYMLIVRNSPPTPVPFSELFRQICSYLFFKLDFCANVLPVEDTYYQAVCPPSTSRVLPVIKLLASERQKRAVPRNSSGNAKRPSIFSASQVALAAGFCLNTSSTIGVMM